MLARILAYLTCVDLILYFVCIMCIVEVSRGKSQDQVSGACMCSCMHTTHTHKLELMLDTHMMLSNRGNEGHDF